MSAFWLSLIIFMGSHSLITRTGLRGWLIARLGKRLYLNVYSLLSLGLLAWLIIAAINAPRVQLWPWVHELYWLPNILMPFACVLLIAGLIVANPLSIMAKEEGFDPVKPGFIVALTRHPIMWGFLLWSGSHLIPNGEYPLALMFGVFFIFSLIGLKIIDKKRKRELGEKKWKSLSQNTRSLIFSSPNLWNGHFQVTSKDKLSIVLGFLLYLLLYNSHYLFFGMHPKPPF